ETLNNEQKKVQEHLLKLHENVFSIRENISQMTQDIGSLSQHASLKDLAFWEEYPVISGKPTHFLYWEELQISEGADTRTKLGIVAASKVRREANKKPGAGLKFAVQTSAPSDLPQISSSEDSTKKKQIAGIEANNLSSGNFNDRKQEDI